MPCGQETLVTITRYEPCGIPQRANGYYRQSLRGYFESNKRGKKVPDMPPRIPGYDDYIVTVACKRRSVSGSGRGDFSAAKAAKWTREGDGLYPLGGRHVRMLWRSPSCCSGHTFSSRSLSRTWILEKILSWKQRAENPTCPSRASAISRLKRLASKRDCSDHRFCSGQNSIHTDRRNARSKERIAAVSSHIETPAHTFHNPIARTGFRGEGTRPSLRWHATRTTAGP